MFLNWISILLQFTLRSSDPSWTCELTHRDPGIPATYFLYCSQVAPDGVEVVSVGKYVPDTAVRGRP